MSYNTTSFQVSCQSAIGRSGASSFVRPRHFGLRNRWDCEWAQLALKTPSRDPSSQRWIARLAICWTTYASEFAKPHRRFGKYFHWASFKVNSVTIFDLAVSQSDLNSCWVAPSRPWINSRMLFRQTQSESVHSLRASPDANSAERHPLRSQCGGGGILISSLQFIPFDQLYKVWCWWWQAHPSDHLPMISDWKPTSRTMRAAAQKRCDCIAASIFETVTACAEVVVLCWSPPKNWCLFQYLRRSGSSKSIWVEAT